MLRYGIVIAYLKFIRVQILTRIIKGDSRMKRKKGLKTVFIVILLVLVSLCSTPPFLIAEEPAQAVEVTPEPKHD